MIVAKAGYGTACEAMAARTPMIYPPRTGFAEHRALDRALRSWGGGLPATARDFAAMKIERLLDRAFSLNPGPPPVPGRRRRAGRGEADADVPVSALARPGSLRCPHAELRPRPFSSSAVALSLRPPGLGSIDRGEIGTERVAMRNTARVVWALVVAFGWVRPTAGDEPGAAKAAGARPKVRVACVGDSITFGTGLKDQAVEAYPARLAGMLGAKWDVRNFGVDGTTMVTKGSWPYVKQPAFQDALKFNPHVVIIMLGTNDVAPQNRKYQGEFAADAEAMIARFAALPSRPRVFIAYPPPVIEMGFGAKDPGVKELQPVLKAVAEQTEVRLIDLYAPLAARPDCFTDGVHPNAAGAEVIARTVYKALASRAPVSPPPGPSR